MPKKARELSAKEVRDLRHPGNVGNVLFPVGGVAGLNLQITPTGARSWILRTTILGRRQWLGLGSYPEVSLKEARERARQVKSEGWTGGKRAMMAREKTFAQAVEAYLSAKLDEFRNEKHRKQWRSTLDAYAVPAIGAMPVSQIGVRDVLRVLEPIWTEKTETASRLRGRIENVMAWATVSGFREGDNPARWKGNLDAILPAPSKVAKTRHHAALRVSEAPEWWQALSDREGVSAEALRFLALTCARSGEVRGMTWGEIDLEARVWTIPAERMKAGREHRVPLCAAAVAILGRQRRADLPPRPFPEEATDAELLVFPGAKGGQLSDMSLSKVMRTVAEKHRGRFLDRVSGRPAVPHGLRSTFRDWAAETGVDRDLAEIALAHTVGSAVERAYRRSDMFERRRDLAESWCSFLTGGAA